MSRESWEKSTHKALIQLAQTSRAGRDSVHCLGEVASKSYNVALANSAELLACTSIHVVDDNYTSAGIGLRLRAIAHVGLDRESSLMMFKNFRLAFPQLRFDPNMHKLMSRKQLVEEYGMFGELLADVAHDPASQPYFSQLIMGNMHLTYGRQVHAAGVSVDIAYKLNNGFETSVKVFGLREGEVITTETPVSQGTVLSYARAAQAFRDAVGHEPEFSTDIHPLWNDYEELAKAGYPVWKPEGEG